MSDKEKARQRTQLLKSLREEHKETVEKTQTLLKEYKKIQGEICKSTREAPKTVPEIAEATGLPAHEVLWHITAMRKYDRVLETGICGEYYLYQAAKEGKE